MNSDQVKTGCMSSKQINIKTVIAVIFLIVDVLAICGFVYTRTENELHHYGLYIDRPDKLTLNKDITETFRDETVTVPAGTVIEGGHIVLDTVYFRYLDEWSFSASYTKILKNRISSRSYGRRLSSDIKLTAKRSLKRI